MKQNSNYLGMTPVQFAILAGLAVTACLLFGLTAWLAFRGKPSLAANPHQDTSVPRSTATPFAIPTLPPTGTPTQIPYEQRIPNGWKQFKTGLVEIWLPADFELGDVDKLVEESRQSYEELGIQELIDYNAGNKSIVNLVATDEISGSPLYRTIAAISYEPLTEESLDVFVHKEVSELPSMMTVAGRKNVQMGSNEAIQLVYEMRVGNIHINSVDYVFLDGMTVWVVSYSAEITEFFQQLPNFEKSIQTFRIVR